MSSIHPLTLGFRDVRREEAFLVGSLARTRTQGVTAIAVGMFVYLLGGILDHWFVEPELERVLWQIRLAALCIPALVLGLAFSPWFARIYNLLLALVGLAAGSGVIAMLVVLPRDTVAYYYPLLVLVTFYTYNFIGTRFVHAFCVDLGLLLAYNLIFTWQAAYPGHLLVAHNFFFLSANLIGGTAGYLAERQRRLLFLHESELEEERQRHLSRSLHDPLTGLPNRDLLFDRIKHALAEAQRAGGLHCGYFLDLDGFKLVNDRLGHEAGDEVLREVARRLRAAVRASDTVARIGGDEFFVLALDIGDRDSACALARKLLDLVAAPMPGFPADLPLGTSIGLCLFPYDGMSVSGLIHRADEAMYRVKRCGKGSFAIADELRAAFAQ